MFCFVCFRPHRASAPSPAGPEASGGALQGAGHCGTGVREAGRDPQPQTGGEQAGRQGEDGRHALHPLPAPGESHPVPNYKGMCATGQAVTVPSGRTTMRKPSLPHPGPPCLLPELLEGAFPHARNTQGTQNTAQKLAGRETPGRGVGSPAPPHKEAGGRATLVCGAVWRAAVSQTTLSHGTRPARRDFLLPTALLRKSGPWEVK